MAYLCVCGGHGQKHIPPSARGTYAHCQTLCICIKTAATWLPCVAGTQWKHSQESQVGPLSQLPRLQAPRALLHLLHPPDQLALARKPCCATSKPHMWCPHHPPRAPAWKCDYHHYIPPDPLAAARRTPSSAIASILPCPLLLCPCTSAWGPDSHSCFHGSPA
jgi:hypothetical protein